MKTPRLIMCATDLREVDDQALLEADAWAKRYDAALVVVHAVSETPRSHVLFPQSGQNTLNDLPSLLSAAADAVAERVERLTARPRPGFDVRVDVGSPADLIVSMAAELSADLIVLGAASSPGAIGPLGSVPLRVVRRARGPVLVVRAGGDPGGPILAASDLSDPAFPAIATAGFLARTSGTPLTVMHVAELAPLSSTSRGDTDGARGPGATGAAQDSSHQAASRALAGAMTGIGLNGQALVVGGMPAVSIVAAARRLEARLLVIGAEGRSGLRGMLLGSTAEQVLRDAPCSVFVVRLHANASVS